MNHVIIERLSGLMADANTTIAKDLKLNFKRIFEDSSLGPEEATMTLLACAKSLGIRPLQDVAREALVASGVGAELVREAEESAAIMGMLNTYYRFRHFIDHQEERDGSEGYGAARLRMQSLANPQLGKERFEVLAFAVSVLNGCEKCVTSHEKALLQLNVGKEKIHDLARLAATIAGLRPFLSA